MHSIGVLRIPTAIHTGIIGKKGIGEPGQMEKRKRGPLSQPDLLDPAPTPLPSLKKSESYPKKTSKNIRTGDRDRTKTIN